MSSKTLQDNTRKSTDIIVHYVSPSTIPSLSANSVHVVMQTSALIKEGIKLSLYAHRSTKKKGDLSNTILNAYGIYFSNDQLITFYSRINRLINLRIALLALFILSKKNLPQFVISRNLYFAFIYGALLRKPLVYETHQIEIGFRKLLQRWTMIRTNVKTVVITKKLEEMLTESHGISPYNCNILPDAAADNPIPASTYSQTNEILKAFNKPSGNWNLVCGYFGQLYEGRGIEIIESIARKRSNILFMVFGGSKEIVFRRREKNLGLSNIFFEGHLPHHKVQEIMRCMDILLMPYQEKVSIGVKGHDTAKWMSPMKMFEYMATGLPIISSDLPSLREVLEHKKNALLVSPSDPRAWCDALDCLSIDSNLADSIGMQAFKDYKDKYTWGARARKIITLLES